MKYFFTLLLFCSVTFLNAQEPVDGFWWNPNESGRGLTFETQNGTTVVAFYAYDEMNLGRWYLGSGPILDGVLQGEWNAFDGGQCSGCVYTSPAVNSEMSEGQFTIVFQSSRKGTMTWSGGTLEIERFMFSYPNPNSFLYGLWSFSQVTNASLVSTQFLAMNNNLFDDDGNEFIVGSFINLSARPAVARFFEIAPNGESNYTMLIDSSPSFYRLYNFQLTKNKMIGLGWLYRKNETPVGSGTTSLGAKYLELPAVNSSETDLSNDSREFYDSLEYEVLEKERSGKFDPKLMPFVVEMQEILQKQK